jgi:hypothetical protein
MKIFLFLFLCFSILPSCFAQDKELNVVAAAGSSYEVGDLVLDWTLGEVIIQTLENPSIIVTQGFHQPLYSLVAVHAIPEEKGLISVLPNPFSDAFEIKMKFKNSEKGTVQLYTMDGSLLWKKTFDGKDLLEKYNATGLPSGSYMLSVSLSDDSFIQTYTILKIQ